MKALCYDDITRLQEWLRHEKESAMIELRGARDLPAVIRCQETLIIIDRIEDVLSPTEEDSTEA